MIAEILAAAAAAPMVAMKTKTKMKAAGGVGGEDGESDLSGLELGLWVLWRVGERTASGNEDEVQWKGGKGKESQEEATHFNMNARTPHIISYRLDSTRLDSFISSRMVLVSLSGWFSTRICV